MRNLLALIGLLVVVAAGAGWYLGWYKLSVNKSDDGNLEIKTDWNTKKVSDDASKAFHNVATVVGNEAEKAGQNANTPPAGTPGPLSPDQSSTFNPLVSEVPETPMATVAPPNLPMPSRPGSVQRIPPK